MELYIYEFGANSKYVQTDVVESAFVIATCQRTVVISAKDLGLIAPKMFEGQEAYDYLLRFACGLESQIKGETDVFGQVKLAYKHFTERNPIDALAFQPIFTKLLEDTKEIRAYYLHGIGGNTYGALARRFLNPTAQDKVLVIGAGQISKSIAPYFADSELTIYNRSFGRLIELSSELARKGYASIEYISDDASLERAIASATLILICTPPGSELDARVIELTKSSTNVKVFHFGAQAVDIGELAKAPHLSDRVFSLTELFEMEKAQGSLRERQVKQALKACRHRAILRTMARSIHIAHGWEDLSAFN